MRQKPHNEDPAGPVEITGTLARFTFRNAETGFAVVRIEPEDGGRAVAAVGQLAQLAEGQRVKLTGQWAEHPKFGAQLEVQTAEAALPATTAGIQAYLASSLVPGIGPGFAERITAVFGADTLRIIDEEPERLKEVKGLGRKRQRDLVAAVRAQKDVQEVMVFLRAHGLGAGLATRIVKRYGRGASALIQADPYRLVDDVIGVGFTTADRLASQLGIADDAPERIKAGILHALSVAAREGHCFVPDGELQKAVAELLGCDAEAPPEQIRALIIENKIVAEKIEGAEADSSARVYPLALHQAERGAAQKLVSLLKHEGKPLPVRTEQALQWFEERSGMTLPEGQRLAVTRALEEPVSVITGGPGVGKTTIIRALTDVLAAKDLTVLLAAPTGRAAKRLEESTGRAAFTIHRLLEFQPGINRFQKDHRDPLEGDLIVVDEASMLDVQLAYNLVRAISQGMKVVLVGDINQLPAVGPGNVLADIIASGRVAVTALTEIYRQKGESQIVRTAHGILQGEVPESGPEGSDFFFVEAQNGTHVREIVRELVLERIPRAFGLDSLADVQVLCPMYRGQAGADAINSDLQDRINPDSAEVQRAGRTFRLGDKVMQIRNDYDLDVFNGDVGRIVHIDASPLRLLVRIGPRTVEYTSAEVDQLVPAYAISVHRSQGSEYPAVVIPVVTEHYMMLRRSLLYTGITRGKRLVVLVGSPKALAMAVNNHLEARRYSNLAARLRDALPAHGPGELFEHRGEEGA